MLVQDPLAKVTSSSLGNPSLATSLYSRVLIQTDRKALSRYLDLAFKSLAMDLQPGPELCPWNPNLVGMRVCSRPARLAT